MDDTKNIKLLKEESYKIPEYEPTAKELDVVSAVFSKFTTAAESRNQPLINFDGLTIKEYIEESFRRYTTNIDVREDIEDWQARVHDQMTRNKVNAVLGKVVSALPIAEIHPRGDEDTIKALICTNLYEYSEDVDDYEEILTTYLNEAIVKGTAILYEGHELKNQKIRDVTGAGDDITVTEATKTTNKLFAKVVKLEDFYPSHIGIRRIKDMPYCFWRSVISLAEFRQDFAMYSRAAFVQPKYTRNGDQDEDTPYYLDYISGDVPDGTVEIIRYYNKDVDEFVIVANGVWLNPIMLRTRSEDGSVVSEKEEVSPIPFDHKELPFIDIKFELFETDFFYGKSLPDKLKSYQDVLNVLTNMFLDQSFLTVFKPILTNGFDSIEDDYLRPGRRTPIDTQGLPINQAVMELGISTPSGWHQYILEYTRKVMEEASVDKVSSGIAGAGDRTTAREINVAAEGVAAMLGLFGRWVKYGLKRKAMLRLKNILQYWTDKNMPVTAGIISPDGTHEFAEAFNVFKIDNTVLSDGRRGAKMIGMFSEKDSMPTEKDLKDRAIITEAKNGKKIEYVAVASPYIRNIDFDVKMIINNRSEQGKDIEKAMQLEKTRVYLSFFPDLVNREELLAQTAEKLGDDPTKIIKPDVLKQAMGPQQDNNKMLDNGVSTEPQANISDNVKRSLQGGEVSANNMVALARQFTG